jgi:hypothetical protein
MYDRGKAGKRREAESDRGGEEADVEPQRHRGRRYSLDRSTNKVRGYNGLVEGISLKDSLLWTGYRSCDRRGMLFFEIPAEAF